MRVSVLATLLVAATIGQDVGLSAGLTTGSSAASFQVLTSGPLHESFARPVVYASSANVAYISSTPPALIDEVTPLQRPAGFSQWIPGYWSFDDAANNWIWVSGTWRVPPAGHTWVSGYWFQTSRGWRYVPGYWAPVTVVDAEIEYLPAPPEPLELTAVGTAPSAESIWVPGNWVWSDSSYAWRSGYWMPASNDYVWTPASYSWTPYGYTYTEGFWDYTFANRGLLYAPVSFTPGSYQMTGFSYTPDYVINAGLFSDSLFVRPYSSSYYFGDYYAPTWSRWGFYPAYAFHMSRYGYDPLFAWSYSRYGRNDGRWLAERQARFTSLRDNPEARPPRTIEEQARRPVAVPGASEGETARVAVPSKEAATANVTPLKIESVPESSRQELLTRVKERRDARTERIKLETQAETAGADIKQPQKVRSTKALMPRAEEVAGMKTSAPQMPAIPKVDANVKPGAARAEAAKLPEPSIERPPAAQMGRAAGAADEGRKTEQPKRDDAAPKDTAPKDTAPKDAAPKPDAGKPDVPPRRPENTPPTPPRRPDNTPPTPANRPEGVPPTPTPPGKPEGVPPTPARRPENTPPTPTNRPERAPQPQPQPPKPDAGRPERPAPQPPARRPEPPKPQPQPQPKSDAGRPAPQPAPAPAPRGRENTPPAPKPEGGKPDGGGKPDEKPHGKPRLGDSESRPTGGSV